ncbi:membrane-bound lytic murein transglycosylase A [Palleronia aestuarii]|uniref:peptidoglycan lytic exotransglycosylase n=2 Tax=Palleronia aestuarii TaxID=568105 RepID=A0A2W7NEX0_9RHOB|nr:MltA domain-containing protein [Palleronia aestuarii]PZX18981.1 membrane-bound lytic murein transglycosylase A [Palleronia aestuarii]
MRALLLALSCLAFAPAASMGQETRHEIVNFASLEGWAEDDHRAALDVFLSTCRDMRDPDWLTLCALGAEQRDNARQFFELFFRPVLIGNDDTMLFTGYFEPELNGSRYRGGKYQYPLYALPEEAEDGSWLARAQIETEGLLDGRGLEIAWIDDPVDVFFLQIQGSGRVRLDDGTSLRVGYAGKNGHDYRSIGLELVRRGEYDEHEVSADNIRNWVKRNGEEGRALLNHNPSYTFFREVSQVPAEKGPLGAMNRSITALRSIAIDPTIIRLGTPVWIEKEGVEPMHRLMVAQDTGSAIKGAQRADIFFGTGEDAGRRAGYVRDGGRIVTLMPIQRAYALGTGF